MTDAEEGNRHQKQGYVAREFTIVRVSPQGHLGMAIILRLPPYAVCGKTIYYAAKTSGLERRRTIKSGQIS